MLCGATLVLADDADPDSVRRWSLVTGREGVGSTAWALARRDFLMVSLEGCRLSDLLPRRRHPVDPVWLTYTADDSGIREVVARNGMCRASALVVHKMMVIPGVVEADVVRALNSSGEERLVADPADARRVKGPVRTHNRIVQVLSLIHI